jgi:hypothetical protein
MWRSRPSKEMHKIFRINSNIQATGLILYYFKKHFIQVNIFKDISSEQIINFLDSSNDPIRQQIFLFLIESLDSLPVSEIIGSILISHLTSI